MSIVTIHGLSKTFGAHEALKSANLSLMAGEVFGLIGLNGAGKTTMIKSLLGLITPTAGNINVFGHAPDAPEARKNYAYLPEKFHPSRYLRGMEYLSFALSYYGKAFDAAQAETMCAKLDLNPQVLDRRVGSYSKGMGQKLGLAGALLVDAPLYILDEPMSGLDPKARIALKEQLVAAKRAGSTVFFSSHILSDIDEICDRIGVIHNGELFFTGTPAAFKQQAGEGNLERAFLAAITARDGLTQAKAA